MGRHRRQSNLGSRLLQVEAFISHVVQQAFQSIEVLRGVIGIAILYIAMDYSLDFEGVQFLRR